MERYSRSLILFPGGGGGWKGGLCGVLVAREVGGLGPGHHWFNTFFNFKIIVDPKLSEERRGLVAVERLGFEIS